MSFDYEMVWTAHLTSRRVLVHRVAFGRAATERVRERHGGGTRTEWPVACGAKATYVVDRDTDGRVVGDYDPGLYLATGHALTLGAHFCRRCWPEEKS